MPRRFRTPGPGSYEVPEHLTFTPRTLDFISRDDVARLTWQVLQREKKRHSLHHLMSSSTAHVPWCAYPDGVGNVRGRTAVPLHG